MFDLHVQINEMLLFFSLMNLYHKISSLSYSNICTNLLQIDMNHVTVITIESPHVRS